MTSDEQRIIDAVAAKLTGNQFCIGQRVRNVLATPPWSGKVRSVTSDGTRILVVADGEEWIDAWYPHDSFEILHDR